METVILAPEDQDFSSCSTETIIEEQHLSKQPLNSHQFLKSFQASVENDKAARSLTSTERSNCLDRF
jgi:hypothetical protein